MYVDRPDISDLAHLKTSAEIIQHLMEQAVGVEFRTMQEFMETCHNRFPGMGIRTDTPDNFVADLRKLGLLAEYGLGS